MVYSKEVPVKPQMSEERIEGKKQVPGSNSFVPSAVGLIIASEVIRELCS